MRKTIARVFQASWGALGAMFAMRAGLEQAVVFEIAAAAFLVSGLTAVVLHRGSLVRV